MNAADCTVTGFLAGTLAFTLLTMCRNWLRRDTLRRLKSDDYVIGWKDACAMMKNTAEETSAKTIGSLERK